MDTAQIGPIIIAITALITALSTLWQAIHNGNRLTAIHEQTNSTLDHLQKKADAATDQKATAAELSARPPLPLPTTKQANGQ